MHIYPKNIISALTGVAVYVQEKLMVTRRDDLEIDTVEALRLEVSLPKSRGFLVGTFYRPDCSSKYYDKDFMVKFNMLDIAAAENKELIVLGDFNCCFMPNKRKSTDCEKLKGFVQILGF